MTVTGSGRPTGLPPADRQDRVVRRHRPQGGAEVLIGGHRAKVDDEEFADGYFFEPTALKGDDKMRVFQEEIFGPVLAVTTLTDDQDALAIANDTLYGLGAGVWTRDGNRACKMGRKIKAGRTTG